MKGIPNPQTISDIKTPRSQIRHHRSDIHYGILFGDFGANRKVMKQWIGFASLLVALSACSGAGTRTDNTTDITNQSPASGSGPNPSANNPLDTSTGVVQDSSTVVGYDTSATSRHN